MKLEGYYGEQQLMQWLSEGKISRLEYVTHNTEEMKEEFSKFCKENGIEEDEYAAGLFLDHLAEETEKMDV